MSDAKEHLREGDVLVVDDDPEISAVLVLLLSDAGYHVRHASNGDAALTAVAEWSPAVLLLDFMMPVMNGGQLIAQLRARGATFPIAIITAWPALALPFVDQQVVCIEKPFDIDILIAWVTQYIECARTR